MMETDRVALSRRPPRRPVLRRLRASRSPRRPLAGRAVAASWTSVAGQRVCRKYRRGRFDTGRLQQREYDKLRRIVPSLNALDTANQTRPRRVSKVTEPHLLLLRMWAGKPSRYVTRQLGQLSLPSLRGS